MFSLVTLLWRVLSTWYKRCFCWCLTPIFKWFLSTGSCLMQWRKLWQEQKTTIRAWHVFLSGLLTYPLDQRYLDAPTDHIQTPSLCCPLFFELSSSLPVFFSPHIQTGPLYPAGDDQVHWLSVLDVLTKMVKVTMTLIKRCTFQRFDCAAVASVSFASVHVVRCRLFPLWAALHWGCHVKPSVRTYFVVSSSLQKQKW